MEKLEEINFGKPTLTASKLAKDAVKELKTSLSKAMLDADIPKCIPKETDELLELAWGLIANAGGGNWDLETERWRVAAAVWRDRYHIWIRETDQQNQEETIDKEE